MRKLGVMSSIATIVNTTCALGFMIYVIIRELQNELPELFMYWKKETFTREFYVCKAFPTIFDNADEFFGFPACDVAVSEECNFSSQRNEADINSALASCEVYNDCYPLCVRDLGWGCGDRCAEMRRIQIKHDMGQRKRRAEGTWDERQGVAEAS
jgi:hypothetical protein